MHGEVHGLWRRKWMDGWILCAQIYAAYVQVYAAQLREAQAGGQPDPPLSVGFSHELCAGIIDKQKPLQEIAHEEVGTLN